MAQTGQIRIFDEVATLDEGTWHCDNKSVQGVLRDTQALFRFEPAYFPDVRQALFDFTVLRLGAEVIQEPDPIDYENDPEGMIY